MLYEFKSAAGGTVLMTEAVARVVLPLAGKPLAAQGIFTETQLPEALARLRAAVAAERAAQAAAPPTPPADADPDPAAWPDTAPPEPPISLAQRAWPLIELMDAALQARQPVTWGV